MSQENVDVVHRAVSAINQRDVDTYLSLCTPDFELINPMAGLEGPNRGERGIRDFFETIDEGARRFELKFERLQPLDDDRVLAWLTLDVESKGGFSQTQPSRTSMNSKTASSPACVSSLTQKRP